MVAVTPPYALVPPVFRFRALAALAGRASLGGERETALAVLMAARLASAMLPPDSLPLEARSERAQAARTWLSSLALPAGVRPALVRVVEASAGESADAVATSMERAVEGVTRLLDPPSTTELAMLVRALRG